MIRSVAWVVLVVAVFLATTAFVPRTYGYPKLLLYAIGFSLMTRQAVRPTIARAATMAAVVVIAFLFRHDHGLFLGMGGLLVAALSTKERSVRAVLARLPAASATSPDIRRSMSSMSACCGRSAAKSCPSYWSPVNLPAGSRCAFR